MLQHIPRKDELPRCEIDLLNLAVQDGPVLRAPIGTEVHRHWFRREKQRGPPAGQEKFVFVRVETVSGRDRLDQAIVGVVNVVASAWLGRAARQIRVGRRNGDGSLPPGQHRLSLSSV